MDINTALGIVVIAAAITMVVGLYIWSARRIDTIRRKGLTSLRQIQKEFGHERRSRG